MELRAIIRSVIRRNVWVRCCWFLLSDRIITPLQNAMNIGSKAGTIAHFSVEDMAAYADKIFADYTNLLTYTAKSMFPLFCELQSGLVKLMADGVINSENMGDNWNWIKTTIEKIEMKENEVLVSELERILDDE